MQPAHCLLEVPCGQSVEVEIGKELAELFRSPSKIRQNLTLESIGSVSDPRSSNLHRPVHHCEASRFPGTVPVSSPIRAPLRLFPTQKLRDFVLKQIL